MDLYVVDWRAVAPILASLIASFTALFIANRWRNQKGAEVVANEVKDDIKDILEIIRIVSYITSDNTTPEQHSDYFKTFKLLYESVVRNSLYIENCVVIDGFKDQMIDFFEHCRDLLWVDSEYKENFKKKSGYINSTGIAMVNILLPYSIYQKKFNFRKK